MKKHFLVVMRRGMDDFPVFITEDEDAAWDFAENADDESDQGVQELMSMDATSKGALWVYSFEGGRMMAVDMVKELPRRRGS